MSSISSYDVAAAVLYGLAAPIASILFLISLVSVRRRNDTLRRLPFLWLKLAMPFFIVSIFLNMADEIIVVVIESFDGDVGLPLLEASWRTFDLAGFFSNMADNIILLCLVELGLSFLRVFGKDGVYQQIIRYSSVFIVVVLFALTFAIEGTNENAITVGYLGDSPDFDWTTINGLMAAYYIIYWIFSLPIVVLSTVALIFSIRRKHLQSLAACFLAASLFNLLRTTWDLAYAIQYEIGYNLYTTFIPRYVTILYPILYTWATIILFILIIIIGMKKVVGLWSQQQQFYGNQAQSQGVPPQQQPEIVVGTPSYWKPELSAVNYNNPA